MKKFLTILLLAVMAASAVVTAAEFLPTDSKKYVDAPGFIGYVQNRFIVVLKDGVAIDHAKDRGSPIALTELQGFADLADRYDVSRLRPQFPGCDRGALAQAEGASELARHYKVYFESGTLEDVMAAFEANPLVERVEAIGIHTFYATPNDTYYDDPPPEFPYDQWHYWDTYGIEADMAWNSEAGSPSVIVGDLDIGIKYDHGDLGGSNPPGPNDASTNGNIWVNTGETPGNGTDDDGNGYVDDVIGWDFVESGDWYPSYPCIDLDCGVADNDPWDGDGHGTHTCGTIAAITNNGYAVAGVAGGYGDGTYAGGGNGVKVVPCRIGYVLNYFGQGLGVVIMDYVAEAMYYMADLKISGWNVAAINCSFGSSNSGGLGAACTYLQNQDVIVVVAAGNSNSSSPDYLGSRGNCLDVGATAQNGNPASFSNYGSWVDIAAPGVEVMSTITDPSDPGGDYVAYMDGTSMSCPHVVGVVALLESYNPSLSAAEKFNIIVDVNNTKAYNQTKYVGVGIVDARKCLDAAGGGEDPPVADFSGAPRSGDFPLTVNFTDLSTNNPTSWYWDFGDGLGTSTQQNPNYTYTAAGSYTVTLTATNAYGSDDEVKVGYITVTTPPPPTADFGGDPTSGDAPLTVDFTDLSAGNPTSWSWDFGDGMGTSTQQNPSYTYNDVGTYTVTLTATNAYGSDDEVKTDYITVTEPGSGYANLPYSTGFESGALDQYWSTVLGTEGRIQVTTANGPRGSYHLTMDDHTNGGSYSQNEAWLHVSLAGKSDVELVFWWKEFSDETHTQDGVFFSDNGGSSFTKVRDLTGGSSTYQEITIDVDQLAASNGLNLTSTFVIKFQQYDNYGITTDGMAFDDVSVTSLDAPPVADFVGSPTSGYFPLEVNFTDQSSGNPTSWYWDFGDGVGTSTAQNPSCNYTAAGTYTVSLTATNAFGSDDEVKVNYITVSTPPPPTADFVGNPTAGNAPLTVDFTDQSTGNPTSWSWDFGDGVGTSTDQNPSYTYDNAGTYTVTLTASNAYGSDDEIKVDYINVTEPGAWTVITYDDFEGGWGSYADGGGDCSRYTGGARAHQGSAALDIQDNSGVASSFYHSTGHDVSGYTELEVEFWYYPWSMDNSNEDFWLQYYDGSTWRTVETWARSIDFENGRFYHEIVAISSSQYNFPTNARLRFMCDASGNWDDVYIDEIEWRGSGSGPSGLAGMESQLPDRFFLSQNYPNPFNPTTSIMFFLGQAGYTTLEVYNVTGQKVATLVDGPMSEGEHTVTWDASGHATGVYLYKLESGNRVATRKMILLK